ncbi:hypothetical protein ACFY30_22205 [Streptomyces sp. NPDC000345]|uniref:hypothetical protein n=1 Tax=Streptomyces sp. NPDC000345 TaxID=3364537 RepID=UPI00369D77F5
MTDTTRAVVLKPGDALLIGNVNGLEEDALEALNDGLVQLRFALGLSSVAVFEGNIEAAALAPVTPMSDAVVVRVFDRDAVKQHRETLAKWLTTNGIDPAAVADQWLSIEQTDAGRLIRYPAYRLSEEGQRLVDPRDPGRAWTVERVSPLVIDLDLTEGQMVTQGD